MMVGVVGTEALKSAYLGMQPGTQQPLFTPCKLMTLTKFHFVRHHQLVTLQNSEMIWGLEYLECGLDGCSLLLLIFYRLEARSTGIVQSRCTLPPISRCKVH